MVAKHLHVIGVDPGGSTGWARLTIPRACVFGDELEPPEIIERDYGEFHGAEPEQAIALARYVRATQSLDYKIGPALVVEAWDIDPKFRSTDPETLSPVRLGAMLLLLQHQDLLGDSTLTFQGRALAKSTMTDERLHKLHLYVASDHIRDAHRHALTALRRARENEEFAGKLWPYSYITEL
jgi:hypothetical protein